ncbi:LAMI_0D11540g1_1 [Lachancea mirantina]|uniref:LAMI_0D11540g1_1 n=1 Tax=Lachancea mirantina TaxID=1230905 RepID=A0A1G4JF19_9SACH|nr:LAMI_0D11540g1_1 [Lachancea mirantina]
MGNNPSTAHLGNRKVGHVTEDLRERQGSITSQLFPYRHLSRNSTSKNSARNHKNPRSQANRKSLFRNDYSLESKKDHVVTRNGSGLPAPPMCDTTNANADDSSSSSLRDHLAGLSLRSSEAHHLGGRSSSGVPALRSPGPSSPVVRPSTDEATPEQLSSVSSLKRLLVEGKVGNNIRGPISSIDIPTRSNTAFSDSYLSDDEDEEAILQGTDDVVINNSLLENAMKRKRNSKKKDQALSSLNSSETIQQQGIKKLKPLDFEQKKELPSFKAMVSRRNNESNDSDIAMPQLVAGEIGRFDSFENGTAEHYEGSMSSMRTSPNENENNDTLGHDAGTRVILKWRDNIVDPKTCKMAIISKDMSSALSHKNVSKKIPMEFNSSSNCWIAPNLTLPAGVYKFRFLINGELRHSNFLPTATDSFGNFVNWFEVISGSDFIEPSRDIVRSSSRLNTPDEIQQPVARAIRPQLLSDSSSSSNWKSSSAKFVERPGTPFSDYTGTLSRSGSAKPPLNHKQSSSYDYLAPLPQKVYEYSNEIPELFKANFTGNDENDADLDKPMPTPPPPAEGQPSFLHQVQDCNQDTLFAELQRNGEIDAQAAEDLFLQQYSIPDLPVYLDSSFLNKALSQFQNNSESKTTVNHIVPHVNLNHLLTSSIRDEIISVGCTTRYEGKFITQIIYTPCYYDKAD